MKEKTRNKRFVVSLALHPWVPAFFSSQNCVPLLNDFIYPYFFCCGKSFVDFHWILRFGIESRQSYHRLSLSLSKNSQYSIRVDLNISDVGVPSLIRLGQHSHTASGSHISHHIYVILWLSPDDKHRTFHVYWLQKIALTNQRTIFPFNFRHAINTHRIHTFLSFYAHHVLVLCQAASTRWRFLFDIFNMFHLTLSSIFNDWRWKHEIEYQMSISILTQAI